MTKSMVFIFSICLTIAFTTIAGAESSRSIASSTADPNAPQLLLNNGDNFKAHFSSDGANLIYISKDRALHKNQQAYEWSFVAKKERRITFSDGDVEEAIYIDADKKIGYLSNTDAIKESPALFQPKTEPSPKLRKNDLYTCDLTGLPIERLTKAEAQLDFLNLGSEKNFLLLSNKEKFQQIQTLPTKGGAPTTLVQMDSDKVGPALYPLQNSAHLIFWLQEEQNQIPTLHRKKGKAKEESIQPPYTSIHDISWWDAEKEMLLVSGKQGKDPFDSITIYDTKNQCTIPLLNTKADLWQPAIDQEKKRLALTTIANNHRQIQLFTIPADLPACQPSNGTATGAPPAASETPKEK